MNLSLGECAVVLVARLRAAAMTPSAEERLVAYRCAYVSRCRLDPHEVEGCAQAQLAAERLPEGVGALDAVLTVLEVMARTRQVPYAQALRAVPPGRARDAVLGVARRGSALRQEVARLRHALSDLQRVAVASTAAPAPLTDAQLSEVADQAERAYCQADAASEHERWRAVVRRVVAPHTARALRR